MLGIAINIYISYYAGIMLNAFNDYLLYLKLCWHNRRDPMSLILIITGFSTIKMAIHTLTYMKYNTDWIG